MTTSPRPRGGQQLRRAVVALAAAGLPLTLSACISETEPGIVEEAPAVVVEESVDEPFEEPLEDEGAGLQDPLEPDGVGEDEQLDADPLLEQEESEVGDEIPAEVDVEGEEAELPAP